VRPRGYVRVYQSPLGWQLSVYDSRAPWGAPAVLTQTCLTKKPTRQDKLNAVRDALGSDAELAR